MRTTKELASMILDELHQTLRMVEYDQLEKLADMIEHSEEIYLAGTGRSGLKARAFAMRLMHLGRHSYPVGDTCTPNIKENGLLILCSGSGSTASLAVYAAKARQNGAKTVLITTNPEGTIAKDAHLVIEIPAPSAKIRKASPVASIQPMGSLFDQCLALLLDAVVVRLMDMEGQTSQEMFGRHANLE